MTGEISVLIVDDHKMVRDMLAETLSEERDIRVAAVAGSADDAIRKARSCRPKVVLFDIDMPGLSPFSAASTIVTSDPDARVVFLSRLVGDRWIEQALATGASGFVSKDEPVKSVIDAVRSVARGRAYFSPQIRSRIVIDAAGVRLGQDHSSRTTCLLPRELQILQYIARAMSNKEIARTMCLAVKTVDSHVTKLMGKLDLHSRVELTRFAISEGLVPVD